MACQQKQHLCYCHSFLWYFRGKIYKSPCMCVCDIYILYYSFFRRVTQGLVIYIYIYIVTQRAKWKHTLVELRLYDCVYTCMHACVHAHTHTHRSIDYSTLFNDLTVIIKWLFSFCMLSYSSTCHFILCVTLKLCFYCIWQFCGFLQTPICLHQQRKYSQYITVWNGLIKTSNITSEDKKANCDVSGCEVDIMPICEMWQPHALAFFSWRIPYSKYQRACSGLLNYCQKVSFFFFLRLIFERKQSRRI